MKESLEAILPIPESVRDDVLAYRGRLFDKLAAFNRGEINAASLRAFRVPMGVYEQRIDGRFMVRVRIGAGRVLSDQLATIALLSRRYGNGELHLTTRQDIQIHDVALEDTPDIFEGLLEAGMSSRGGGGNTVRNVSACPHAGRCPNERFNAAPDAIATAACLLEHPSSFNLPRKYKIAFSGCGNDCALASVADCGFFARIHEGEKGFMVYAGGGLGGHPRGGVIIEEFIPRDQAPAMAEAVRRVFDRHGDRTNKHRARLRFVLDRLGESSFRALCREQYVAVQDEGFAGVTPIQAACDTQSACERGPNGEKSAYASATSESWGHLIVEEKCPDTIALRLPLPLGNISADDLTVVARMAGTYGLGLAVTTQRQELLVPGLRREQLPEALATLRETRLHEYLSRRRPLLVACAGASTCKLGICLSRALARAIEARLDEQGFIPTSETPVIRISGCPNSCGGHQLGIIGLEGRAQRHHGRLMPMYAVLSDGKPSEKGARLAKNLGVVPARRIPELIAEALTKNLVASPEMEALVAEYGRIPEETPEIFYHDHGADEPFSLAGRGPGECGAGVFEVIQLDIREADGAVKLAKKSTDAHQRDAHLYHALVAGARALLPVFGTELHKDREIFKAFSETLVAPGWVSETASALIDLALDWKLGDYPKGLGDHAEEIAGLVERVANLYESLDANLKFRLTPIDGSTANAAANIKEQARPEAPASETTVRIDLRNVACPINFVKAKVALEKLPVGALLEVLLDDGDPIRNVPASFTEQGQEVVAVEPHEDRYLLRIRRNR